MGEATSGFPGLLRVVWHLRAGGRPRGLRARPGARASPRGTPVSRAAPLGGRI